MSTPERRRMREDVREVDFPIALRGYDRAAVDRYVERVNLLIAELEITSSPESAIRRALEEVSEETSGLLQRAYETAEDDHRPLTWQGGRPARGGEPGSRRGERDGRARGAGDAGVGATRDTGAARDHRARST